MHVLLVTVYKYSCIYAYGTISGVLLVVIGVLHLHSKLLLLLVVLNGLEQLGEVSLNKQIIIR